MSDDEDEMDYADADLATMIDLISRGKQKQNAAEKEKKKEKRSGLPQDDE
jgi:hypothetical protein